MQDTQQPKSPAHIQCPECKLDMDEILDVPFRIGGSSGGWHLMFGQWAELSEDLLALNMFICHQCGRVQFYADEKTRKTLQMD